MASEINVGLIDRAVRIAIGIGVVSLLFFGPRTPFALIGIIPLLTGILGFCPIYYFGGISTCPTRKLAR
jgi:hypothetical protein